MQRLKAFGVVAIMMAIVLAVVKAGNLALDAHKVSVARVEEVPAEYLGKACEKRPGTCPDFCYHGGDRTGRYDCAKCGTEYKDGFRCDSALRYD